MKPVPAVAFFGNSESRFSNRHFAALLETQCSIVAVVDIPSAAPGQQNGRAGAQPPAPRRRISTSTAGGGHAGFAETARAKGIPVFAPANPNTPDFVAALAALAPDLLLAVGYLGIFGEEILAVPRLLAANFHASLLPAYRGKHPVFWALRNDERRSGITVHVIDRGIDTGDILYQVAVRTRWNDSVAGLYDRIMDRSLPLVGRLTADVASGVLAPRPQGEAGASYFSSVRPEDFRLDWSWPARRLRRWICTSPGECFAELCGRRVYFLDAQIAAPGRPGALPARGRSWPPAQPGTVLSVGRRGCVVATGDAAPGPHNAAQNRNTPGALAQPSAPALASGALRLRRIRPEGEPEQDCAPWIRRWYAPGVLS